MRMSLPLPVSVLPGSVALAPPPPTRVLWPVPMSVRVLAPAPPIRATLPDPLAVRVPPLAALPPPKRIALPVPSAARFVAPVNALASTTRGGLPRVATAVRLAVLIPLRVRLMPSPDDSDVLVRVKPAFLLADTVLTAPCGAVSLPARVQPLTSKLFSDAPRRTPSGLAGRRSGWGGPRKRGPPGSVSPVSVMVKLFRGNGPPGGPINVTPPAVPTNTTVPGCITQFPTAPPSLTVQAWLFW